MNPADGYEKAAAVTPSDSTVVDCIGFFVGGAGNVAIVPLKGSAAVTLTGCLAGHVYRIAANKIMSTNTTATAIVALY
jgi:hypothetical protein